MVALHSLCNLLTDQMRLAFTRPRCLAADLELASVDFATVEVEFELNRSDVGRKYLARWPAGRSEMGRKQIEGERVMFT